MLSLFTLVSIIKSPSFLVYVRGEVGGMCTCIWRPEVIINLVFQDRDRVSYWSASHQWCYKSFPANHRDLFSLPPKYWDSNEHYNIHFPYQGPGIKLRSSWFQDKHLAAELLSQPLIKKNFLTELRVSLRYPVLPFFVLLVKHTLIAKD